MNCHGVATHWTHAFSISKAQHPASCHGNTLCLLFDQVGHNCQQGPHIDSTYLCFFWSLWGGGGGFFHYEDWALGVIAIDPQFVTSYEFSKSSSSTQSRSWIAETKFSFWSNKSSFSKNSKHTCHIQISNENSYGSVQTIRQLMHCDSKGFIHICNVFISYAGCGSPRTRVTVNILLAIQETFAPLIHSSYTFCNFAYVFVKVLPSFWQNLT